MLMIQRLAGASRWLIIAFLLSQCAGPLPDSREIQIGMDFQILNLSPDGAYLAASDAGNIHLYELTNGLELWSIHTEVPVSAIAFSPDSSTLAIGYANGTVSFWDVSTGAEINTLPCRPNILITEVAFSPSGEVFVCASGSAASGYASVWNLSAGEPLSIIRAHTYSIDSVAWSPNSVFFASGSPSDWEIILWNAADGEQVHIFEGHTSGVTAIRFAPNGQLLASGSGDETVIVWNVSTGDIDINLRDLLAVCAVWLGPQIA